MDGHLDELCEIAEGAATARGHRLRAWRGVPGEQDIARRTVCSRCGRAAVVRADKGLSGLAGAALLESCTREREVASGG